MNYQTTAIAIVGIICATALTGFALFVNWQTDVERCTITTEMQHELMTKACEATIVETFRNMDKELCSTWDAEVELEKLKNSGEGK